MWARTSFVLVFLAASPEAGRAETIQAQGAAVEQTAPASAQANYVIGPNDVLNVTVWKQVDISGKYTVEQDGTFTFPLLGRVTAMGLTLRGMELELTSRLSDGLFKNPQVTVSIEEYRSKRVFVVGEVRQPGTHVLNRDLRLIEALARAGSTTATAADYVLIVRPAKAAGPVLPGQDESAEVIRVELGTLQGGELSQNVALRDNDTIFVPRAAIVFVSGRVRNPGSYPVTKDTTVLQALSLAGGVTDFGAANRIRVLRMVNGVQKAIKVQLNSPVEPGDTIIVPERFF